MITRSRASYVSALDPSCPVKSEAGNPPPFSRLRGRPGRDTNTHVEMPAYGVAGAAVVAKRMLLNPMG